MKWIAAKSQETFRVAGDARSATPAIRGLAALAPSHPIPVYSLLLLAIIASLLTGCASWRPQATDKASLAEARQERHAKAVQAFEQTREQAQLTSALDRWQQGDVAGCESRLRNLVQSRPQFCEAHVHLAELAWSFENADEAIAEYQAAIALAPQRAELHHALGLVLEATGRQAEAQQHLAQAAALDPQSELFRAAGSSTVVSAASAPIATAGIAGSR
jgi:Tfp pilus assembly protein PilF